MNAAAKRARAEAQRIAAANAAANAGGPPYAPPVVPPVGLAAALPPAAQVVIGADALAQIIAACQPQPHVARAGAILPEGTGSIRLKAFSSSDLVEWMSWKTHYLEVCEINAWPNIRRFREARAAMAEKAARHTAHRQPGRQTARPDHHLAGSHRKVPGEVHAGRCWRVLLLQVQHCKTDLV
jgi:hypothetical protein